MKREKPRSKNPLKRIPHVSSVLFLLTLTLLIAFSSLFHTASIGQVVILLYGLYAIIRKIPSDTTLKMALIALATVMVLSIVKPDESLPGTFAIYSLLLLVVWIVSLPFERKILQKSKKVM